MRSKNILWITLAAMLLTTALTANITLSSASPTLYVDPALTTQPSGDFTIEIKVSNVTSEESLYGWEFTLGFTQSVLEILSVTRGPFLRAAVQPQGYSTIFKKKVDNFMGEVTVGETVAFKMPPSPPYPPVGATGDGTLAFIEVHIKMMPPPGAVSQLSFVESDLYTVISNNLVEISHDAVDGLFDNRVANEVPVAVFDVKTVATEEELLTFDASMSTDDGWIVSYEWDFGYDISLKDKWTGDNVTKAFVTSGKPVVPGSEDVYVNGFLMTEPTDYTIDCETGTITFTTAPEVGATIEATYTAHPQDSGMIVFHAFPVEGTYTVSLTVTDNDGVSVIASQDIQVLVWMEEGDFPDLIDWQAKPEKPKWWETLDGQLAPFYALIGNPTSETWQVYVEFTLHSKDEAAVLGTIETTPETIAGGAMLEVTALLDLTDNTWACLSGSPEWVPYGYYGGGGMRKYQVFARCYADDGTGPKVGNVVKYFHFNVLPARHNIGVDMWTAAPDVTQGDTLDIYANITNYGSLSETFVVDVTYKGEFEQGIVEQREVTVAAGTTATETFTWDTTGVQLGIYIIKVTLPVLTYEYPRDTGDQEDLGLVTII